MTSVLTVLKIGVRIAASVTGCFEKKSPKFCKNDPGVAKCGDALGHFIISVNALKGNIASDLKSDPIRAEKYSTAGTRKSAKSLQICSRWQPNVFE